MRCRASKYMREKIMMQEVEIIICRTCSYKRGEDNNVGI